MPKIEDSKERFFDMEYCVLTVVVLEECIYLANICAIDKIIYPK